MSVTKQAGFAAYEDVPVPIMRAVVGDLHGAADAMGPGTLVVPMFQPQILDIVKRRGVLGQRIKAEPATGQPSRYFEQTRIVVGQFQDPRSLSFQPTNDPTRRERYVFIKALVSSIGFNLFDVELTRQQGQFGYLVAKDVDDAVDGLLKTSDLALWNGTDTSMYIPTSIEYVGLLNQINRTASIASSARIIDGLKAEIAAMCASIQFDVHPTAVYLNPILGDLIDQEERLNQRQVLTKMEVLTATGGLTVNAIATQAGLIPLLPDSFLQNGPSGGSPSETGKTDYKAVILSEGLLERHYVTSPIPRVFQLGLEGNLATRYEAVLFDGIVAKGSANASQHQGIVESGQVSYAHSVVTVVR